MKLVSIWSMFALRFGRQVRNLTSCEVFFHSSCDIRSKPSSSNNIHVSPKCRNIVVTMGAKCIILRRPRIHVGYKIPCLKATKKVFTIAFEFNKVVNSTDNCVCPYFRPHILRLAVTNI